MKFCNGILIVFRILQTIDWEYDCGTYSMNIQISYSTFESNIIKFTIYVHKYEIYSKRNIFEWQEILEIRIS